MSKLAHTPAAEKAFGGIEMRTARRHLIMQRCFVHPVKTTAPDAWRCVAYNISAAGIGITLPARFDNGTLMTIQAWGLPRACTLQARIVRTKQVDLFWFTGCELVKRLSDTELKIWCSGPLDWIDDYKQQ
jgi:hypothetical protein